MNLKMKAFIAICVALVWLGCSAEEPPPELSEKLGNEGLGDDLMKLFKTEPIFETTDEMLDRRPMPSAERRAYFGDLHVHTKYSFDAFAFGTLTTPYEAYRYARGEAIMHPVGIEVQLRQPLDFYAVTDHAMFLGVSVAAEDTTTEFSKHAVTKSMHDLNDPDNRGWFSLSPRFRAFTTFLPLMTSAVRKGDVPREEVLDITREAWRDIIEAAELYNDPGRFTTFIGFEYTTSAEDSGNLHRNVIFRGSDQIPAVPYSRYHSQNPEDLWVWMDDLRARGVESLAIPHNSNASNGHMFELVDAAGDPIDDAYAELRMRNEPLVEITQLKGTSETHPALSTRDEWADFEIMPYLVASMDPSEPAGGYVRDALLRGLSLEQGGVVNPYEFGFIGSTDSHSGLPSDDEADHHGDTGIFDGTPELRASVPLSTFGAMPYRAFAPKSLLELEGRTYVKTATSTYGVSGLAGVWAEENTRDAIYEALRRKETFATSGPRIQIRFFGSFDFEQGLLEAPDVVARAYAQGVTMGGELPAPGPVEAPHFLLWALADPQSAPLQRLQVVKGWVDSAGESFEQVYDVACSGGAAIDPDIHRCPDNGSSVDLTDCSIENGTGVAELKTLWRDPAFDPEQRAFYYARVLENPTCRWSTWDALRAGVAPKPQLPKTLQERAWSSPIWFRPDASSAQARDAP